MLQEAAVLGVSFDEALLQAVAGEPGERLAGLDSSSIDADLSCDAGPARTGGATASRHALVHEVVYENLLLSRRSELHERAGRALEQAVGPSPSRLSDLEALGHHWSFTADKARGARYLMAAGDRARAVYANDDAIRHYERALATLAGCQACDDQVAAVRERLADLLALTGRRAEAWRITRPCARARGGGGRSRRRPPAAQDRRPALGSRRSRARQGLLRAGLERLGEDGRSHRARAPVPGARPPGLSRRRQCRRDRVGRAGARRGGVPR